MESALATPAAPAQPAAPESTEKVSAVDAAVTTHDVPGFRAAKLAERTGKPLEPVAPVADADVDADDAPPAPVVAGVEPPVSKRQQKINDDIRAAVAKATTERDAEIARLKAQLAPAPRRPEAPAAPATPTEPAYKRYLALPDAPKLADFDTIEDYSAAMGLFIATKTADEREATRQATEARTAQGNAVAAFTDRGKQAHDDFEAVMATANATHHPWSPALVRAVLTDDAFGHELAYHLATHEADAQRISALRDPVDAGAAIGELRASLKATAAPPAAPKAAPKLVTDNPAPPAVLGTRPTEPTDPEDAAVAAGDVGRFREVRLQKRVAALR